MKFHSIKNELNENISSASLEQEYAKAHAIGNLRIGDSVLFFRVRTKMYYIPYSEVTRCFRRVRLVSASICCGRGDLPVESMVICDETGELADIQMPGEKAGKAALEELKQRIPHAVFTAPIKKDDNASPQPV